ncbi:MAG TPA: DUF4339 domain-containing protein [Acidobacteriota bacterium]|nr:DUF4339 domain-containing protein [Acidobacteriota bacterium]
MEWYYKNEGQQIGPVTDDQFNEAIRAGKITESTLVWNKSLSGWQDFATILNVRKFTQEQATKTCSSCGQNFLPDDVIQYSGATVCASCKPNFFQTIKEAGVISPKIVNASQTYFPVSKTKLIVMALATFGIYEIYWFYKNWEFIRERTGDDIRSFWRALLSIFYIHKLLRAVKESADSNGVACSWSPNGLAWCYILLSITWRLPDPYWMITLFSFVPLVYVQGTINEINAKVVPFGDKNSNFNFKNIVAIAVGLLWLGLVILGSLLPE